MRTLIESFMVKITNLDVIRIRSLRTRKKKKLKVSNIFFRVQDTFVRLDSTLLFSRSKFPEKKCPTHFFVAEMVRNRFVLCSL